MGWKVLSKMEAQNPCDSSPPTSQSLPMNVLLWNCRGALNPRFQRVFLDLVNAHAPSLVFVTETRIGREKAKQITDLLPFDRAIHVDKIGYSGGLWLLWNSDIVEVTQLAKIEQEIHVMVKVRASNIIWLLSSIYASPRLEERKLLWGNLANVASLHQLPWLMLGDYNELLSSHDKLGGNPLNPRQVQLFKECLDACGMVDLGFHGPKFTWVNKRDVGCFIRRDWIGVLLILPGVICILRQLSTIWLILIRIIVRFY